PHFFVPYIEQLLLYDPDGKGEQLWLREGLYHVDTLPLYVLGRRVHAFVYGGPDGKTDGYVVPFGIQVASIFHADLLDLIEEMLLCISCENIDRTGIHAYADKRKQSFLLPFCGFVELIISHLDMCFSVGIFRMWDR